MPAVRRISNRRIVEPSNKLDRLIAAAAECRSNLTTRSAVAKSIGCTPPLITQYFRAEAADMPIPPKLLGQIVAAFNASGVYCEVDWFHLGTADFAARVEAAPRLPPKALHRDASDAAASAEWELHEGTVLADLVELRLHPPRPANEPDDAHVVDATLLFGTAKVEYEPEAPEEEPRTVAIALREARLAIGSESYRPLKGSSIGERVVSDNFARVAGGVDITGPRGPAGTLEGDPLGGEHLAVIAGTHAGDGEFAVGVAALRGSFVVGVVEPGSNSGATVPASVNRNAILNSFIYSRARQAVGGTGRDDANRVVLARATMKRRPGDNSGGGELG